jgi:hypothetical protein
MAKYLNASFLISIAFGLAACVPSSHRTAQNTEPHSEAMLRLASLSNPGNPFELNKGVRTDNGDPFEVPLRDTCRPLVGPDGARGGWVCPAEDILRALGPLGGQWKAMADSTTSAGCWISCASSNGKIKNERCLVDLLGGSCYCGTCP